MLDWLTGKIALYVAGALLAALVLASGAAWYFKHEYSVALEDKGKLEVALESQKAATKSALDAVDAWKESAEAFQATLTEMTKAQREATKETRRLNETFAEHNIGDLAKKKPRLVESRVNAGAADMRRLLMDASRGPGSAGNSEAGREAGTP